jgi:hypothetical protein
LVHLTTALTCDSHIILESNMMPKTSISFCILAILLPTLNFKI